jgi:hypothetical protein
VDGMIESEKLSALGILLFVFSTLVLLYHLEDSDFVKVIFELLKFGTAFSAITIAIYVIIDMW